MKKTLLSAGIVAIALSGFAGTAMAQSKKGGEKMRPTFEQLDANGDGSITMEDLQARGEARFAEADTNNDGNLSKEEILASQSRAKEDRVERMIEKRDANGDGQLSLEEMAPKSAEDGGRGKDRGERMFKRLDTNEDGAISKAEFDEGMAKHGKRGGKKKDQN